MRVDSARLNWRASLLVPVVLLAGCISSPTGEEPSPSASSSSAPIAVKDARVHGVEIAIPEGFELSTKDQDGSWVQVYADDAGQSRLMIGRLITHSDPEANAGQSVGLDQASQVVTDLLAIKLPGWRSVGSFKSESDDFARVQFSWTSNDDQEQGTFWLAQAEKGFLPVVLLSDDQQIVAALESSILGEEQ